MMDGTTGGALDALRAKMAELDSLAARLAEAERAQPALEAEARDREHRREEVATDAALGRADDRDAEAAEADAEEAARAAKRGARLIVGLKGALREAERETAALADDAATDVKALARAELRQLAESYAAAVGGLAKIVASAVRLASDANMFLPPEAWRLPARLDEPAGPRALIWGPPSEAPGAAPEAEKRVADLAALITRAARIRDRLERAAS
jgi:hypothetical protein